MTDQTVFCTLDVDITAVESNREGLNILRMKTSAPSQGNIFWRFDVSSLVGKMWDSVVFMATYQSTQASFSAGNVILSRVLRPMNYGICTSTIYDTGLSWDVAFAENNVDNDHSTNVNTASSIDAGTRVDNDILTSVDITNIVKDGRHEANGLFDLIMYSTSSGGATVMELYSIENNTAKSGKLFFTNVRNMELSSSNNPTGTAANIAVPSATVLSKSGRPPIAGASRQESASILHDGVEPMTILAITLKGQFGADN